MLAPQVLLLPVDAALFLACSVEVPRFTWRWD